MGFSNVALFIAMPWHIKTCPYAKISFHVPTFNSSEMDSRIHITYIKYYEFTWTLRIRLLWLNCFNKMPNKYGIHFATYNDIITVFMINVFKWFSKINDVYFEDVLLFLLGYYVANKIYLLFLVNVFYWEVSLYVKTNWDNFFAFARIPFWDKTLPSVPSRWRNTRKR
jgi:hypothetical protein